jgi:O-antigen/teichoic acid export membrane protein
MQGSAELTPPGSSANGRSGFLANVNLVFISYVANAALSFGVAVLVARTLGADGRGIYALFLLSASILQAILSLGLGVSAVYYLGKGRYSLTRVVSNVLQLTFASAVVTGLLSIAAWPLFGAELVDEGVPYWLFALAVPLFLAFNLLTTVLQGASRFAAMSAVVVAQPLILLLLMAIGAAIDVGTRGAIAFWCVSTLSGSALALMLLGLPVLRELLSVDLASLADQVRFGIQGQIGNLIQLLNYRLDQYFVLLFVNTAGVGVYAVSSTLSQTIWFLPNAVAAVLLPRLTATSPGDAARTTPLVCRHTLLISALAATALGVVSPWLVEALFGDEFSDSVLPLLWLLPGAVALAGSKVLTSYIFSQGRPLTNSAITAVSLVVTIGADLALIPRLGVTGAAVASTLAYATHFALSLVAYRQLSGGSVREAVLVRGEDIRLYLQAARQRLTPAHS